MKKKGRVGSSFDDFLKEEGIYSDITARAIKRVIARQLDVVMQDRGLPGLHSLSACIQAERNWIGYLIQTMVCNACDAHPRGTSSWAPSEDGVGLSS